MLTRFSGCLLTAAGLFFAATAASLSGAVAPTADQQACLDRARYAAHDGWVHLRIDGNPADRGFQHGYLLAARIAEELRVRAALWKHETSMEWSWAVEQASALFTPKIPAECLAELDGIAAGMAAGGHPVARADLIAYNAYFELAWYWWPEELKKLKEGATPPRKEACSAFIATGSMTRDGGVVLGHNTWFGFPLATANVVLEIHPDRGHRILMQTYPGWIHSGTDFFLTDAGLVGAETTIGGVSGFDPAGVPEFVRFRQATQTAGSIDEWCALMQAGNNGGYANAWLLGDVHTGEIARLELAFKHVSLERTRDGCFTGSNIAEDLRILRLETDDHESDIRASAVARRVRWKELMREHRGRIDRRLARRLLADHRDTWRGTNRPGSRSLCGHGEVDAEPGPGGDPFRPGGCFDAKVVDTELARRLAFEGRWGRACGTPFHAARFLDRHPQYDWMEGLLQDRPTQPWTSFHMTP